MDSLEQKIWEYGSNQPDKVAVVFRNEITTYGDLLTSIKRNITLLNNCGVKAGDKVILQAIPGSSYISMYISLHLMRAVVIPLDRKAKADTINNIIDTLNATYFVGKSAIESSKVKSINYQESIECKESNEPIEWALLEENDLYDILYTTGTTGQSKGVVTTRHSVISAIQNEIVGPEMNSDDVLLIPIPLNHSFGIGKMRAILYLGGTVVLQNGVSMVAEVQNNIEQNHCTCMICVPSALEIMIKQATEGIDQVLSGLRFIEVASEPFSVSLKQRLISKLPLTHILNRYGSTETPAAIYLDATKRQDKLDSIGKNVPNVQIKVVDEELKDITDSCKENPGRLAICGEMLFKEYFNDSENTNAIKIDGWVYSKDLAYIDDEGYIFLLGRADDVINTGGKKFAPSEIEKIVEESDLCDECVVVGIEDKSGLLGSVPAMVYVPKNLDTEKDIIENAILNYLRARVEKYKLPTVLLRIDSIPRNYMGKIERKKIKELFSNILTK